MTLFSTEAPLQARTLRCPPSFKIVPSAEWATGGSLPDIIGSHPQQCRSCGHAMQRQPHQRCMVLAENCLWDIQLSESKCTKCGRHSFDGAELLLLRKATFRSEGVLGTFELFFHWDVIFKALQELEKGHFFFDKWVRLLDTYKNVGVSDALLCAMSKSLYRHFREAVIDGVELMNLDYGSALRCACAQPLQSLVADGVTLSCGLSKLFLVGPWLPQQQDGVPVMLREGSLYDSRFAVRDASLRSELRAWASVKGVPLPAFEAMMQRCAAALGSSAESALRTLAVEEQEAIRAVCWARPLLRELGVDSPACAAVPWHAVNAVLEWVTTMRTALQQAAADRAAMLAQWESPERMRALRESVPVLWPALRELQQIVVLAEPESVGDVGVLLRLVAELAEVRCTTRNFAASVVRSASACLRLCATW